LLLFNIYTKKAVADDQGGYMSMLMMSVERRRHRQDASIECSDPPAGSDVSWYCSYILYVTCTLYIYIQTLCY